MEGHESAWDTFMVLMGGGAGTAFLAFLSAFRKPREEKAHGSAAVVGATMISDGAIDKATLVIREAAESLHDDMRRVREALNDMCESNRELSRVVREGLPPVASVDLAGVMARLGKIERERTK